MTLREAAQLYFEFIQSDSSSSRRTIDEYRYALNAWERFGNGAALKPISDLKSVDFSRWKNQVGDAHAPATKNKHIRAFRAVLHWCEGDGLIERVPQIRSVPEPEQCKWRPSLQQLGDLYRAVSDVQPRWPFRFPDKVVWWQAFIVLGTVGALRKSELGLMRKEHVTEDGIEIRTLKRKRLTIVCGLPCVVRHVNRLIRSGYDTDPRLLPWSPGAKKQMMEQYKAIGEAAGCPEFTPHSLKRAGVDLWFDVNETCGKIVGHKPGGTAMRIYLHRRNYLLKHASELTLPPEFDGTGEEQLRLF